VAAILIAIGNPLRGDDGVAHFIADRLPTMRDLVRRNVLQLTPEHAAEIASFNLAIFVDADVDALELRIENIRAEESRAPLTHVSTPGQIVAIARNVFAFSGKAYYCRVSASDFAFREGLSRRTALIASKAEGALLALLMDEIGQRGGTLQ